MRCPSCGRDDARVIDTRTRKTDGQRVRTRACSCGCVYADAPRLRAARAQHIRRPVRPTNKP